MVTITQLWPDSTIMQASHRSAWQPQPAPQQLVLARFTWTQVEPSAHSASPACCLAGALLGRSLPAMHLQLRARIHKTNIVSVLSQDRSAAMELVQVVHVHSVAAALAALDALAAQLQVHSYMQCCSNGSMLF